MGGKVWLIGQDLLFSPVDTAWMRTYFHLDTAIQDYAYSVDSVLIQGLAEISGSAFLTTSDFQVNLFFPDELIPDAEAHGVLEDADSNKVVGIFYDGADWMSTFWTMEGRDTSSFDNWLDLVNGMFDAFTIVGMHEYETVQPLSKLELSVVPDVVVETAMISYSVPVSGEVSVQIFDKVGREVAALVEGSRRAGTYRIAWDCNDTNGAQVSNGVYFVRLMCDNSFVTRKFVFVK
jgi:hypothetical protein